MTPVRVLLVDDQMLFRDGLRRLLSVESAVEVVGEAKNGAEALALAKLAQPDVVLMDLRMDVMNGVDATLALRQQQPQCQVLVLTTFDDDEEVFAALRAGAIGYLLKDAPTEQLVEAICLAHRGESFLQPSVAAKVIAEFSKGRTVSANQLHALKSLLSDREFNILQLLVSGRSNKQIAKALHLAEGTVKNHMTNILDKLGVQDRTQAALKAQAAGLQ